MKFMARTLDDVAQHFDDCCKRAQQELADFRKAANIPIAGGKRKLTRREIELETLATAWAAARDVVRDTELLAGTSAPRSPRKA